MELHLRRNLPQGALTSDLTAVTQEEYWKDEMLTMDDSEILAEMKNMFLACVRQLCVLQRDVEVLGGRKLIPLTPKHERSRVTRAHVHSVLRGNVFLV